MRLRLRRSAALQRGALWLLSGLLRVFVRPAVVPEDAVARLRGRNRPVLYVFEEPALSDRLTVARVCLNEGLRRPDRRLQINGLGLERSSVALERRAGMLRRRPDRRMPAELPQLIAAGGGAGGPELDVVPVAVYWGRAPQRERSWLRLFLSEDWALVGPFRRLLSILFNGRGTLIRFGEPLPLRQYAVAGGDGVRAARRLLKDLRAEFRHMRVDTLGPDLSTRRVIIAQVLRTRAVRQAVRQEMREAGSTRRAALQVARRHALEIAAGYSHSFVRIAEKLLDWLLNRIYDGVDVRNAEYLDRLPPHCAIVYAPCHRSHLDYLLLSYVVYRRGYALPYVAAGINLNLPVIGRLLRMGGAFYIRRSFRGVSLYPIVFMKYVDVMMGRGQPLEFFIEGGRSRTGRLLRPRTGLLAMTVRSFLREPRRPVAFVPANFGYERVLEVPTYVGELSGRPKQKETVGGLMQVLPQLRQQLGRVHVSFGEPLLLETVLDRVRPGWRGEPHDDAARPAWFSAVIDAVAAEIMRRINGAAAVTPVNLLAVALLATPRQALLETDLERQLALYAELLRAFPYSADLHVCDDSAASIISRGEQMGLLERRAHPAGDVLRMLERDAVLATYYRNNVLHLFALPSLLACAFLNNPVVRHEDLHRLAWRIYPYVREELFLRWNETELPGAVDGVLETLARFRLLQRGADGASWQRPATGTGEAVQLSLLAQATIQIVERYYLAIALLMRAGSGALTADALEQSCVTTAQRMAILYGLAAPEFFDRAMFRAFIDLLRRREVISASADGRLIYEAPLLAVADDARFVLSEQIRNSILQITHS
ncbi:MAG: glycerol-3-phosphate 1-O-acyltransferase PlsB [Gammaproteobacteria bacterium]|nr:glycerol-3-phosphate 1-O-acyltransferase PlsB [Gammaproteobacteria bacterium]